MELYTCPNGHPVQRTKAVECEAPGCQALTIYEPSSHGLSWYERVVSVSALLRGAQRALANEKPALAVGAIGAALVLLENETER
jgi:hypothetical protein